MKLAPEDADILERLTQKYGGSFMLAEDAVKTPATHFGQVLHELAAAKEKHPHFVDRMTYLSDVGADTHLEFMRNHLKLEIEVNDCDMHAVLLCEFYEAMQTYAHGDLAHARQELAQCAAVCIRGMEYIQNEIDKQNTKQTTTTQGDTTP